MTSRPNQTADGSDDGQPVQDQLEEARTIEDVFERNRQEYRAAAAGLLDDLANHGVVVGTMAELRSEGGDDQVVDVLLSSAAAAARLCTVEARCSEDVAPALDPTRRRVPLWRKFFGDCGLWRPGDMPL